MREKSAGRARPGEGERFWLNGRFVSDRGAAISLLDRGLLYGDSLYEVIRFYSRRPFLADEHLDRLFREAAEIELPERFTREMIGRAIRGLVARSPAPDGLVLLHWTRGEGPRRLAPPPGLRGNVFAVRLDLPLVPGPLRRRGVDVIAVPDERWHGARIKSTNLLASVLARTRAARAGAWEAVLFRGRGARSRVTEATGSSVFVVRRGILATPAVRGLLPGITRSAILSAARRAGIRVEERTVLLSELRDADEAFLTATSMEILPIARVDAAALRCAVPGPTTRKLVRVFARFRDAALAEAPPVRPVGRGGTRRTPE